MIVKDDLGRAVTIADAKSGARRIVTLTPAATENLFAIGAGARVVGVTAVDNFPPQVSKLPRIGANFYQPSVERVRALAPDLVLVDSATIDRAAVATLESRLKSPLFVQLSDGFDDVERHLLQLGRITGREANARSVAAVVRRKAAQVEKSVRGKPKMRVFVEISASPLYAAGPGSFVDDLITRAGGVNVVRGTSPYPQYSREALLAADPDHYIVAGGATDTTRATLPPPLDRLRAARTGNVHRIPADLLFRPTPRLADGLVLLARALHGG